MNPIQTPPKPRLGTLFGLLGGISVIASGSIQAAVETSMTTVSTPTTVTVISPSSSVAADPTQNSGASSHTEFELRVGYGQSRDFWKTVQDVQSKTGNLPDIQAVLTDRYGHSESLFSTLRAQYSAEHTLWDEDFLHQAFFGSEAEAIAGGEVANPVSPRMIAYSNTLGIVSAGLKGRDSRTGPRLRAKAFAGFGPEKRIDVSGPQLLDGLPVQSGILFTIGAEAQAGHRVELEGGFEVDGTATYRPSYFISEIGSRKFWTHRWKLDSRWLKEFPNGLADYNHFGISAILGQQPLPMDLLPLSWDYQNQLQPVPKLSALAGTGLMYRARSGDGTNELEIHAGLYGGFAGAMVQYRFRALELRAATYSLDNGLGLSGENGRIWSLGLGVAL